MMKARQRRRAFMGIYRLDTFVMHRLRVILPETAATRMSARTFHSGMSLASGGYPPRRW